MMTMCTLLFVLLIVISSQICIFCQNLVIRLDAHRVIAPAIVNRLPDAISNHHPVLAPYRLPLRTGAGAIELNHIHIHRIDLIDAIQLRFSNSSNGGAYLYAPKMNISIDARWNYSINRLAQGIGQVHVDAQISSLGVGYLRPISFAGIPFIGSHLNCSLTVDEFDLKMMGNLESKVYILAERRYTTYLRSKLEHAICTSMVSSVDTVMRELVHQLHLKYLLVGHQMVDYRLASAPRLHNGSLISEHFGIIRQYRRHRKNAINLMSDRNSLIDYIVNPHLIAQLINTIQSTHLFNVNMTVDTYRLQSTMITAQLVIIPDEEPSINITSHWLINGALNHTFTMQYPLTASIDQSLRIRFQIDNNTSTSINTGNEYRFHPMFESRVIQHYKKTIANYMILPLPTYNNISDITSIRTDIQFVDGLYYISVN